MIETGWMIETATTDGQPAWWTGGIFPHVWSTDHLKGVRFCRKSDALTVMSRVGIDNATVVRPTEHQWGF